MRKLRRYLQKSSNSPRFAECLTAQTICFVIPDEFILHGIKAKFSVKENGNVHRVTRDMGVTCDIGIGLGFTPSFHTVEKVPDMECGGVATDLGHFPACQKRRRTQCQFAAITGFDPTFVAFKPDGARTER